MSFRLDERESSIKFASYLRQLEDRITALEGANPLTNASIEGGSLDVYDDDGNLRGSLGVQEDGSFATVAVNSYPPPTPAAPTVEPALSGLIVAWDGLWADADNTPSDFATIQIHVGPDLDFKTEPSTLAGTISTPLGGSATIAVDGYDEVWVRLVAVNTAALTGEPGAATPGTPRQAVGQDLVDAIIDETKLAQDAVTEAKVALGAIGSAALADSAVTTQKILAGAITAEKITALAITAEKIAALAVTTDKLSALSVTTDKLAVNSVTATKIAAGAIQATHIKAGAITAEKIDANALNGKVITGATVQTAATGDRVVVTNNAGTGLLSFFNTANRLSAELSSGSDDTGMQAVVLKGPDPVGGWNSRPSLTIAADGTRSNMDFKANVLRVRSPSPLIADRYVRMAVTGYLAASNIECGHVTITPTPNSPTSVTVTGLQLPLDATTIRGVATANTTVPGTAVRGVGLTDPTPRTVTISITRTDATPTGVDYILIAS